MKVFVWIGIHMFVDDAMGDIYAFAETVEQAREVISTEWAHITAPEFLEQFKREPTSIFEGPMAWVDEYFK